MSIRQSMRDIDRAVEAVGNYEEYEADWDERSPRETYERSIEEVAEIAGKTEAERLAMWIETTVRDEENLPAGEQVRTKGAEICRDVDASPDGSDWLEE